MLRTTIALAFITLIAAGCTTSADRQEIIHERGSEVMPFELSQTTHVFNKTADGGLQQVVVKDANDSENVERIREHLSGISREFADGDFSDPRTLHGDMMPGVAVLEEKHEMLNVTYTQLPDGARIMYRSDDDGVVSAVHDWFDAQLSDHGDDATAGAPGGCDVPDGHDPELWRMHNDC